VTAMPEAVIAIMQLVPLVFRTADEVGVLIAHLQNHQRTLIEAQADDAAARAALDGTTEAPPAG
jgi:hypothetical protein